MKTKGVKEIIGKRIKGVLFSEGAAETGSTRLYLIFSDNSFYEFYSSHEISTSNGLGGEGLKGVKDHKAELRTLFELVDERIKG